MTTALTITKTLYPVSEYLPKLKSNLEARATTPAMPITFAKPLNDMLWGFHRGKFYIIAARPSVGKSAFALQMAYDQAMNGKRVLFLSLEMTVEDMLERLFCHKHQINNQELVRGNFNKYIADYDLFCQELIESQLVLSDCIGRSWEEVEEILSHMTIKPDIIFIDHLNAIKTGGFNAKAEIDMYILNLCTMAKQHNIAVALCCQINRDNQKDDDKTPQLHELKGSGNLEEAADVVMMLHWPYKYKKIGDDKTKKTQFFVIVGKNRNGPTGYVELIFKPEVYTYADVYKPQTDNPPPTENQPRFA